MKKIQNIVFSVISIVLTVAFPIYFLYCANADIASISEIAQPMLICTGIGVGVLVLSVLVLKKWNKATLVTCLFMVIFQNFAMLEDVLKAALPNLKYWHTVPIMLMIWFHIALAIWKLLSDEWATSLQQIVCLVMGALIAVNFATSIPKIIEKTNAQKELKASAQQTKAEQVASSDMPNVYLLVFDEYAGFRQLEEYYHYGNAALRDYLNEHDFFISENSHNESIITSTIMTNVVNLAYVVDNSTSENEKEVLRRQGTLFSLMSEHGYAISVVEDGDFYGQESPTRNIEMAGAKTANGEDLAFLAWQRSMAYPFVQLSTSEYFENAVKLIDYLSDENNIPQSPTFTLAHVVLSHAPFVVDENGKGIPSNQYFNWTDDRYYLGQLKYTTKGILKILDNIIKNDPDAVIILQSDHGARASQQPELFMEKFPLDVMNNFLNAVYYRGEAMEEIDGLSAVNTLRYVLSDVLNESYELLEVPEDTYRYK